jgi:hypothetical protein
MNMVLDGVLRAAAGLALGLALVVAVGCGQSRQSSRSEQETESTSPEPAAAAEPAPPERPADPPAPTNPRVVEMTEESVVVAIPSGGATRYAIVPRLRVDREAAQPRFACYRGKGEGTFRVVVKWPAEAGADAGRLAAKYAGQGSVTSYAREQLRGAEVVLSAGAGEKRLRLADASPEGRLGFALGGADQGLTTHLAAQGPVRLVARFELSDPGGAPARVEQDLAGFSGEDYEVLVVSP